MFITFSSHNSLLLVGIEERSLEAILLWWICRYLMEIKLSSCCFFFLFLVDLLVIRPLLQKNPGLFDYNPRIGHSHTSSRLHPEHIVHACHLGQYWTSLCPYCLVHPSSSLLLHFLGLSIVLYFCIFAICGAVPIHQANIILSRIKKVPYLPSWSTIRKHSSYAHIKMM